MAISPLLTFLTAVLVVGPCFSQTSEDAVLQKVLELGRRDNQVMRWNDIAANRFGGRYTGSDAYNNATDWAVWQLKQWGLKAWKEEVGEVAVGFNRGPWFGKMITPSEKALYFGTPSCTAGTKGVQRGPVVVLPEAVTAFVALTTTASGAKKPDPARVAALEATALAAIQPLKTLIQGAWVLWPGQNEGFARDGRKDTKMSKVVSALAEWGALGTIQSSKEPLKIMDGSVKSWEDLPVLPDIKLTEKQFLEIKALASKGEKVELEFEIRNWFKMGPVKYHNVIAVLEGSEKPDEYVVVGGHFDSFDGGTGGVDDGNGFSTAMEALRLLATSGAKPKRSVMLTLFAAEEMGLVGSTALLKAHPEWYNKISVATARDGSPSAITGFSVAPSWYADFEKITAPLKTYNAKFPFELKKNEFPSVRPEKGGGTDITVFSVHGIPTLGSAGSNPLNNHDYGRDWHTLLDTYSEVVPFTEHQQHTAVCQAVMAYGVANLDRLLSRDGLFLPDGLYADFQTTQGRVMTTLDAVNLPAHTRHFVALAEAKLPGIQAQVAFTPGGPRPTPKPVGKVTDTGRRGAEAILDSEAALPLAGVILPPVTTAREKGTKGTLGLGTGNHFFLSLPGKNLPGKTTPIGKVIAGAETLAKLKKGDEIRSVRILRVGEAAKAIKIDSPSNEAPKK